ncbi:hypothetical protein RKD31_004368 [Streptomyces sp. SAI-163]
MGVIVLTFQESWRRPRRRSRLSSGPRAVLLEFLQRRLVLGDVLLLVQIQRTGELLQIDDIREVGLGEAQERERATLAGVPAEAERHDLEPHIGAFGDLDQVLELAAHHLAVAVGASQGGLVEHDVELGGGLRDQVLLPFEAQRHPPLDVRLAGAPHAAPDDRAGVLLGLQQAVHELHLVGPDQRGGALQPHVGREPAGQHVGVTVPPARDVGLLGQGEQGGALLLVRDAVQRQQVLDVPRLEAHPAQLHPADLRLGGADRVARRLARDPPRLTQSPEL